MTDTTTLLYINQLEMPNDFFSDILCTAVEGGCNYWADIEVLKSDDDGNYLLARFTDAEDESTTGEIGIQGVVLGIQAIINGNTKISPDRRATILQAAMEKDAGLIDGDLADCIVQAALFNDIVYS